MNTLTEKQVRRHKADLWTWEMRERLKYLGVPDPPKRDKPKPFWRMLTWRECFWAILGLIALCLFGRYFGE